MKVVVLDGYVDEPGNLGVPPFLGIYPRYMAGAALDAGAGVDYVTIDDVRSNGLNKTVEGCDTVVLVGGVEVPGKYLTTMPASPREIETIKSWLLNENIDVVLAGPLAGHVGDTAAYVYDFIRHGEAAPRDAIQEEWNRWAVIGARIASIPIGIRPTIAELETYRGCVRHYGGGCLFCVEPTKGEPRFRMPRDIEDEVRALYEQGIKHFRLGGQTCIFSYMASGLGSISTPVPDPCALEELLKGVRRAAPKLDVLHVDNANPAVLAANIKESLSIAELLVEHCTSGNVVALGLESADPVVAVENNLNTNPQETMQVVKMLNEVGGTVGESGLPDLLPGINFLGGLIGETEETYEMNFSFLQDVLSSGLLLRRINIRQARWPPGKGGRLLQGCFRKFKKRVREEIDREMLIRIVPVGTVLRDVYTEMNEGHTFFGRQMGSYPLLVGIPYDVEMGEWYSVAVTDHGSRSVTGVTYPIDVNTAPLKALESLPGIGRRRALRIFHGRPINNIEDLESILDEEDVVSNICPFIIFSTSG